ncbi:3-methyl-2-oxobutanoate hydroxymethyltransferase [Staphylothermus marinus F1]|uniref:3-methyl-2-oxobutanoate hydroxymethyltransferase n=1 Tax=Staphylothermus marinus (strain ATCC 43588 / DSM 3639 / JCM 9404 / F1) TaxID=399550 RepID=PANB_STAMF|nr:3-methyl-2-oxobutanoate hydroxymethyltransferase [Staphylothermus marinus]A3DPB2.1 RecName: Full=3-methyl-2-oxobutanoate hydroxymethyltransferase; AltName: Full=Ketopantoate hydroxymethyltransferase; Short=KPHMT [Staphylothermus marinus F1]ABN70472.1 3-methyl-2-oxobutanoate hydroxymethyltransferase [Staphylothermus marinus F1]
MKKITIRDILKMKGKKKIVMVTAYDYPFAKLVDEAGVDIILVGDSAGMVVHGLPSTIPVTMDMMLLHVSSVARAKPRALIVGDMPFLSYEVSIEEAVRNAGLMLKSGAEAVKIEGGSEMVDVIKALVRAGIPVMGHIGLTPQRYLLLGGYRRRGVKEYEAEKIIEDAKELEKAGVFSIVIEFTAADIAEEITKEVSVPTICIGSGPYCDGQVLVLHDLLGIYEEIPPFAKKYADLRRIVIDSVKKYAEEVRNGVFPERKHYFFSKRREAEK